MKRNWWLVVIAALLLIPAGSQIPLRGGMGIVYGEKLRLGDVAEYQTVLDDSIATDTLRSGLLVRMDHDAGPPPAYLSLQIHLQGSAVALSGYLLIGEDSTHLGPQLTAQNDTVWFLERGSARADTGWFAVACDAFGMRWARLVFLNDGAGTAFVRARVWCKAAI